MDLTTLQEKGYMPAAILNWLALAGWGTTHGEVEEGKEKVAAPTSTEMFTLPELIEKVGAYRSSQKPYHLSHSFP